MYAHRLREVHVYTSSPVYVNSKKLDTEESENQKRGRKKK